MLNYLIERFDSVGMEERKAPKVTGCLLDKKGRNQLDHIQVINAVFAALLLKKSTCWTEMYYNIIVIWLELQLKSSF